MFGKFFTKKSPSRFEPIIAFHEKRSRRLGASRVTDTKMIRARRQVATPDRHISKWTWENLVFIVSMKKTENRIKISGAVEFRSALMIVSFCVVGKKQGLLSASMV